MFHINEGDEGTIFFDALNSKKVKGRSSGRTIIHVVVYDTYATFSRVNGVQIVEETVLVSLFNRGGEVVCVLPKDITIIKFK